VRICPAAHSEAQLLPTGVRAEQAVAHALASPLSSTIATQSPAAPAVSWPPQRTAL